MKKISNLSVFAVLMLFLVPATLVAQASEEAENVWNVQFETQFLIGQNFINEVGSEMETFSSQSVNNTERIITQNYGFTERPIEFNRNTDRSFAVNISHGPVEVEEGFFGSTSFNVRLERTATSSSLEGGVESDPGVLEGEGTLRWVKMWDANVFPVFNTDHPSFLSPVDYWAHDEFDNWAVEVLVEQNVFNLNGYSFGISGGFSLSRPSYTLVVGQSQRTFGPYIGDWVLDNEITLETTSKSRALMLGPSVGFNFEKDAGLLDFDLSLQHTVFHSWNDQVGIFTDVDNIRFKNTAEPSQNFTHRLDGNATFERERTDWVSNTDLRLTVGANVGPVELGAGATVSLLKGMPLAPTFHDPWGLGGSSKAPTGLDWKVDTRNISLSGLVIYVSTAN